MHLEVSCFLIYSCGSHTVEKREWNIVDCLVLGRSQWTDEFTKNAMAAAVAAVVAAPAAAAVATVAATVAAATEQGGPPLKGTIQTVRNSKEER